jgi:HK97 family phage major capsid protein
MPTIDDLILSIEVEREQTQKRYERATAEINNILAKAKTEGRANLTSDEDTDIDQAFAVRDRAKIDLNGIDNKLSRARKVKEEEADAELALRERAAPPTSSREDGKPSYDRVFRVTSEERTYHRGVDRDGSSFLKDVTKQFLYRDIEAEQRLSRHMQEERVERGQYLQRAAGTGAFAGLTVPQYLTDMYAPAVAALRPFADQCNKHELPPDGMTVNISQITTATSAALQASENSAVSETNIDDTLLTENVQTAAGQQTLSRQAIDRGTGVEGIVLDDLFRRYATVLDSTLINQATTGLGVVSAGQTYTDASPTGPKIYSQLVGAMSTVESTLLGWAQPDMAVMHPRRWYKLLSAVSSTWPMIVNDQPIQAVGSNSELGYAQGIRGRLANGLKVCVDANVTTLASGTALTGGTQDHIYVVPTQEMHLWEDSSAPFFIRAEQPAAASLGVVLVLYGYFAYCFRRFGSGATVKVNGSGLAAPVFDGT